MFFFFFALLLRCFAAKTTSRWECGLNFDDGALLINSFSLSLWHFSIQDEFFNWFWEVFYFLKNVAME
jgi:hypothetical protein